jgi:hypothetical protein
VVILVEPVGPGFGRFKVDGGQVLGIHIELLILSHSFY